MVQSVSVAHSSRNSAFYQSMAVYISDAPVKKKKNNCNEVPETSEIYYVLLQLIV